MQPFPESDMMCIPPASHGVYAHKVVARKAHDRLPNQLGLSLYVSAHRYGSAKKIAETVAQTFSLVSVK